MTEAAGKLPVDAADRPAQEELAGKMEAALTAQIQVQKTAFLRRQAVLHLKVYQALGAEVEAYCREKGIDLVVRVNTTPVNPSKPDDVLRQINQQVVYFKPAVDITAAILERLKQRENPLSGEDTTR